MCTCSVALCSSPDHHGDWGRGSGEKEEEMYDSNDEFVSEEEEKEEKEEREEEEEEEGEGEGEGRREEEEQVCCC